MKTTNESVALWFEEGGLKKMKIESLFTVFKLVSIFGISSIPFWFKFHKDHYDISDVTVSLDGGWYWGYYLLTYSIMSYCFIKPLFQKVNDVLDNEQYFRQVSLNIDSVEATSVEDVIKQIEVEKEDFLTEGLKLSNFLIALEDKEYLNIRTPLFKSLLSTRPFEVTLKQMLIYYYFNNNRWTHKTANDNAESFTELSKRVGWIVIPFIPALIIFSTVNHIITYINNRDFLSLYDYNRFALWKFRYYNEFLTQTKKRLSGTKEAAQSIVTDLFLENWKSSIAKGLSFLFSLFSLFLLIFSLKGYERLWGADVIPLIALFTAISASLFPRKRSVEGRMSLLKATLLPDITRRDVSIYFESKISILLKEVLSILALPIVFFWVLPDKSYYFAHFMSQYNRDGKCVLANWDNKDKTKKTMRSYEHVSKDPSASLLDI